MLATSKGRGHVATIWVKRTPTDTGTQQYSTLALCNHDERLTRSRHQIGNWRHENVIEAFNLGEKESLVAAQRFSLGSSGGALEGNSFREGLLRN